MDQSSGVAIGRRWTETVSKASKEAKEAGAGALLTTGGIGAVKGASETQARLRHHVTSAKLNADDMVRGATRAHTTADAMKGKTGAFIRNPAGQATKHRFNATMAREAATNYESGIAPAQRKVKAAERYMKPRYRTAQRTKVGGLAVAAGGAYLGLKGLAGMQRNRNAASFGYPSA